PIRRAWIAYAAARPGADSDATRPAHDPNGRAGRARDRRTPHPAGGSRPAAPLRRDRGGRAPGGPGSRSRELGPARRLLRAARGRRRLERPPPGIRGDPGGARAQLPGDLAERRDARGRARARELGTAGHARGAPPGGRSQASPRGPRRRAGRPRRHHPDPTSGPPGGEPGRPARVRGRVLVHRSRDAATGRGRLLGATPRRPNRGGGSALMDAGASREPTERDNWLGSALIQVAVVVPVVAVLAYSIPGHRSDLTPSIAFFVVAVAVIDLIPVPGWGGLQLSLSFPVLLGVA